MKDLKESLESTQVLAVLKNNFKLNTTGTVDDLLMDIQDMISRDDFLSLVADNIIVTIEGGTVTLHGEVYKEEERMKAGNIAAMFAGKDHVNNYLRSVEAKMNTVDRDCVRSKNLYKASHRPSPAPSDIKI